MKYLNSFAAVAVLATSNIAFGDLTSNATVEFLDCSCEVRSKHTMHVDDWDIWDDAINAHISTRKCLGALCYSRVNTKDIGYLDRTDEVFGGDKWGVVSAKTPLSIYNVGQRYCATTDDSGYADYRIRNTDLNPPSTINISVSDCDDAPSGGQGNCEAGSN